MIITIDDCYGSNLKYKSRFATPNNRRYVGIEFSACQAYVVRSFVLEELKNYRQILDAPNLEEFHFQKIYNKSNEWRKIKGTGNISVFEKFGDLCRMLKPKVHVQSIDDHTYNDHNMNFEFNYPTCFDLRKREHISLVFLLFKIKKRCSERVHFIVDEGVQRPGYSFKHIIDPGNEWVEGALFQASVKEPLLQFTDFIAYCIQRQNYLMHKKHKSIGDEHFARFVGRLGIISDDLTFYRVKNIHDVNSDVFDKIHAEYRSSIGMGQINHY